MSKKIMWRVNCEEISAYKIQKETDKMVWFLDRIQCRLRGERKHSENCNWFDTQREAVEFQRGVLMKQVAEAQKRVNYANRLLDDFETIYPKRKKQ